MKNLNRKGALILAALLLSQTAVSCGSSETVSDTTAPTETTEAPVDEDLEHVDFDKTFNGETFTMYLAHPDTTYLVEEETGDIVDDALVKSKRLVEEQLNVKLNVVDSGFGSSGSEQALATAAIASLILAGDDTNDIYLHVQHTGMPGQIAEGYYLDWNTIPYINFEKPYWYQKCLSDINYYDKVFAMTGAYNLASMSGGNILLFNKQILDDLNMEYPYQMVKDGTWVVDTFKQYIIDTTKDLNGDTTIDKEHDQIGYWGWGYEQYPAFFMGLGGDIVTKQPDGSPLITVNNERTVNLIDKMNEVFALDGSFVEWDTFGIFQTKFKSGELTFLHASLSWLLNFRDMEDDYGGIPYPKLDEKQESYCVRVQNGTGLTYIPITNHRLELTGAVLETFACASYNYVLPAYFETALTAKGSRDTETEEMIPIIRESCSFYDEAATGFAVRSAVDNGLASYWAGVEAKVTDAVQKNIIDVYGSGK